MVQKGSRKGAEIVIRKNKVYLHISFEKVITDTQPNGNYIGIDRGISNLLVSNHNRFFGGGKVKQQVRKFQKHRSKLQQKGTKSAKRHLQKLSGKESRFRADINHQISKAVIDSLHPGDTLVLEDLTGIRKQNRLRRRQRTLLNSWSFFQLEQFLTYKAGAKGIHVVFVDASYTSQKCFCCGHTARSNRKTQANFQCVKCGFKLHADLNAARNIAAKYLHPEGYMPSDGAVVNQPIVATEKLAASHQSCTNGN